MASLGEALESLAAVESLAALKSMDVVTSSTFIIENIFDSNAQAGIGVVGHATPISRGHLNSADSLPLSLNSPRTISERFTHLTTRALYPASNALHTAPTPILASNAPYPNMNAPLLSSLSSQSASNVPLACL